MYTFITPVDIPTTVEPQLLLRDAGDKKDRGAELREGGYCYREKILWPLMEELNMLQTGVVIQVTHALCSQSLPVKFQQNSQVFLMMILKNYYMVKQRLTLKL